MNRAAVPLFVLMLCAVPAFALYTVSDTGDWPKTWPKQIDPLRKQARTLIGPEVLNEHYAIRFKTTKEFEKAWPRLLSLKTKGAPVTLLSGPNFFLGDDAKAGVIMHCPPKNEKPDPVNAPVPIAGVDNVGERWMHGIFIDVVVDGKVITKQSVKVPKGTEVIDHVDQKH